MPNDFYAEMVAGYSPVLTTEAIRAFSEGDFERFDELIDAEVDKWLDSLTEGTQS
jgi:hypothetical protein